LIPAFPIHAEGPGAAAVRCVDRLGNLQGIHIATIDVPASENFMIQKVQAKNEIITETLVDNGATYIRQVESQIAP